MLPTGSSREKVAHGSFLSDNFGGCRVNSQWQLTVLQRTALAKPGTLTNIINDQASITLAYGAAFAAFLFAWPYILLWDILIDPTLAPYRALFLLAYIGYAVGFAFFALSGAETARVLWSANDASSFSIKTLREADALRPIYNALSGSLATALSAFFATRIG